ncbi:MAG: hypothetical protein NC184_01930 [Roseburia sp.]|nr:hypothetical protein [Roseburia sp.]
MASKTCAICGKPSGMYPLCNNCFKLRDEGKIKKCPKCGTWHLSENECTCGYKIYHTEFPKQGFDNCVICGNKSNGYAFCKDCWNKFSFDEDGLLDTLNNYENEKNTGNTSKESISLSQTKVMEKFTNCIVCNENSNGYSQCRNCYNETLNFKDSFDKNTRAFEFRDYYFNLKSNIMRIREFIKVQENCNKLMAIALINAEQNNDNTLKDRVIEDIQDIIKKRKPLTTDKVSEYTQKQDSQKEYIKRTLDGHIVKSDAEVIIDDILYNLRIPHCYEKRVSEINDEERTIMCDWFIPIESNSKGIYIEYWGMDTDKYIQNKKEKKNLYKVNDIPLLEIEKDEIKSDSQGLQDRIRIELNKIARKYYRIKNKF